MRLGGVDVPSDVHCAAHSDGDAVCHAVTDAILGAAGLGDIGELFPDTAAENKDRDSIGMLEAAVARLGEAGWRVGNVDVTVIAQRPKIGPHRAAIRARLASALLVAEGDVSIKGKTNEGMGWIGREEGLGVMAVALVLRAS
jgi:2-C-methyl-D-erythritol 2,4-cyclodiphosphate synthase